MWLLYQMKALHTPASPGFRVPCESLLLDMHVLSSSGRIRSFLRIQTVRISPVRLASSSGNDVAFAVMRVYDNKSKIGEL